jgi:hypothetical protein
MEDTFSMAHPKPTTTHTGDTEDAPKIRRGPKRSVVFSPFTGIPTKAARLCLDSKVSDAALRLWLTLALESEGKRRVVTFDNQALMDAARVGKNALAPAREELMEAGVLAFTAADTRREAYSYDLDPAKARRAMPPVKRRDPAKPVARKLSAPAVHTSSWGNEDDDL